MHTHTHALLCTTPPIHVQHTAWYKNNTVCTGGRSVSLKLIKCVHLVCVEQGVRWTGGGRGSQGEKGGTLVLTQVIQGGASLTCGDVLRSDGPASRLPGTPEPLRGKNGERTFWWTQPHRCSRTQA